MDHFWPNHRVKKKDLKVFFSQRLKNIHFLLKIYLKNTIFEHFCQKHSILVVYSFFVTSVHQKGSLLYCEMVTCQSSWPPSEALFSKWLPMLEKIWPLSEFSKQTSTHAKICRNLFSVRSGPLFKTKDLSTTLIKETAYLYEVAQPIDQASCSR